MKISLEQYKNLNAKDKERFLFSLCDQWRRHPKDFKSDIKNLSFVDWATEIGKEPLWFNLFFSMNNSVFSGDTRWEMFDAFCGSRPDKSKACLPLLKSASEIEKAPTAITSLLFGLPLCYYRLAEKENPAEKNIIEKDIKNVISLFSVLDEKHGSSCLSASLARNLSSDIADGFIKDKDIIEWFYAQHSAVTYSSALKARVGIIEHLLMGNFLTGPDSTEDRAACFWKLLRLRHEAAQIPMFLPYSQRLLEMSSRFDPEKKFFIEKLMLLNGSSSWPWIEKEQKSSRKKM